MCDKSKRYIDDYYEREIYPVLTPMVIDSARPFPLLLNKTLNIAALLKTQNSNAHIFGTIQVPSVLSRLIKIPTDEDRVDFVLLEDVIKSKLYKLFSNHEVLYSCSYRITKDADLEVDEEDTIDLLKYLVKGARIISLTGEQGCGKTTMLMAMIENIYETMNLRITETAFEIHLRKIYPTRNILSMRETETISGQACLDVQKKTDGSVNIIGEVATDPVASWMIQSAQVASKFTLFTHHAKTFPDLVTALRNSMLRAGVFKDERTAEEQVVSVLNFDIHLVKDFRGRRYIERITECIPVEERNEYTFDYRKEKTLEGKLDKFMDNATNFFTKTTNRELYKYRNVLEYHDGTYVLTNPISDHNIKEMLNNMDDRDAEEFKKFVKRNYGIDAHRDSDEIEEETK